MTALLYIRRGSLPVLMSSSAKHYSCALPLKILSTGFLKSLSPLTKLLSTITLTLTLTMLPCGVRTRCSQPLRWQRSPHGGWYRTGTGRGVAWRRCGFIMAHVTSVKSSPTHDTRIGLIYKKISQSGKCSLQEGVC